MGIRNLGFWGRYWDASSCWIVCVQPSHPEAAPCADFYLWYPCLWTASLGNDSGNLHVFVLMICFVKGLVSLGALHETLKKSDWKSYPSPVRNFSLCGTSLGALKDFLIDYYLFIPLSFQSFWCE